MDFADINLYLVRQGVTPKNAIVAAQELFEADKLDDTVVVFNDILSGKYSGDYDYGYGYGYYEDEDQKKKGFFSRNG